MVKRIAFFGGSFNPIQNAHREIVDYCINHKEIDDLWIVPTKYHAFKGELKSVSDYDRLEMIRLGLADLKYSLQDFELRANEANYTIDSLRKCSQENPKEQFLLIIGQDNLENLNLWKSYTDIFNYADILCFSRSTDIKLPGFLNKFSKQIDFVRNFNYAVSSSEVRSRISKGMNFKDLLHPDVHAYIKRNHLYETI